MTFPIGNRMSKPDFPGYVAEKIRVQSDGPVAMTPRTPWWPAPTTEMLTGYEDLGYEIDTLESALYEFLVGKDYVDSWFSEAHGRFCFFSPDELAGGSGEGRFPLHTGHPRRAEPMVDREPFRPGGGGVRPRSVPDPWSVLLVAEKPL